jgi:predicted O-linked N-acetylglucosamine transferase (SPINDLY family)
MAAGHLAKAEALCRHVIERQPENLSAHITLASCISSSGNAIEALPVFERVLELDGNQASMASTIIFELNYLTGFSREEIFRRHLAWAERYEAPLLSNVSFDDRDRNPKRKLRIGYVSGDFCGHPVGFLLRDILRNHDRKNFEIHCFSTLMRPDDVSADIQAATDVWEDAFLQSEEELTDMIRRAGIDLLIDLSGHTAFHRLLTFARRPAPVQATWIGYFHSTGMSSLDYFITDPHTSPARSGQLFSETAVHLPHTRFCYVAPEYAPNVGLLPAGESGPITFGSFNRLAKLNEQVLDAWAGILQSVAHSRLVLKAAAFAEDSVRERFLDQFARRGVDASRLDLRMASPHREMLEEYGEIDIALDPFPFNGGMTTLEALWMGVPVLTLEGDAVVSRQTYSVLANLDLTEELACSSVATYVERAEELANDRTTLIRLRSELRPRMAASPIRQAEQFTRDLEALYRRMWLAWCDGERLESDVHSNPRCRVGPLNTTA